MCIRDRNNGKNNGRPTSLSVSCALNALTLKMCPQRRIEDLASTCKPRIGKWDETVRRSHGGYS
eukprot:12417289-Alexandrium_andersonii.AAC.1